MSAHLDDDHIAELRDLMADDFASLVDAYLRDSTERLRQFELALASADYDQARRQVHSLKGSSSNIGAASLARHCQLLEQALMSGKPAVVGDGIEELHRRLDESQRELRLLLP